MITKMRNFYSALPITVRATFWFFICAFMQKAIAAISTPIYTRIMNSEQYGMYNVFVSWQGIFSCIISLNMYGGFYTQGLVKYKDNEKLRFSASLQGLSFTLSVIWLLIYCVFSKYINCFTSLSTLHTVLMIFIIWATSCFNYWSVAQRVQYQYKKLVILTLGSTILSTVLSIIFVILCEDKVTARIIAITVVFCVFYGGVFVYQLCKGKCFFQRSFWKYALHFSIPLVPHYLSQIVLNSSDRIMISNMVNLSSAGIYSLAYSIAQIMMMFNTAMLQTIEPWIYNQIKNNTVTNIRKIAYPAFTFIAVVNVFLIAFAPEVVRIFAPQEYQAAIWLIPPISMSVFFMFVYSFFSLFEFYYETTKYIAMATMAGAILNIILNYVFIDMFGYFAASYTTLVCYIVYVFFHYLFMNKLVQQYHSNVKVYDIKVLLVLSVGIVVTGFLFMYSYSNIILRYFLILLLFLIISINYKKINSIVKMTLAIRKK